jgi:hypothetical protein
MKNTTVLLVVLFPALLFAQEVSPAKRGFAANFFPVPALPDNVTIAGEHFKFSQQQVEYNIEMALATIPTYLAELKAAKSEQTSKNAKAVLDVAYLELAYNIVAAEVFGSKSDKLFTLLQTVEDNFRDEPLPARVVTPSQLYSAIGGQSFANPKGLPMEIGSVTDVLTFGNLVIEARDQILYRSGDAKQ